MNKQIEELAKDIENAKRDIWASVITRENDEDYLWHSRRIAEHLTNLGYQKVDEDSVVLSKEEYNIIDHNIKHLETVCNNLEKERDRLYEMKLDLENQLIKKGWTDYEGADEIEKRVRKETAREILHKIYEQLSKYEAVNEIDYDCWVDDVLYEIAKQYGVEIKE